MASQIDPSKPADGVPAEKADLRTSLQAAKDEIEALQSGKSDIGHGHTLSEISDAGALAAKNTVAGADIDSNAITATKIADGAVTSLKIAASAVGSGALASSAVTAAKIADAAVTNAKIAGLAVGTGKLADGAVTGVKIAAGAVGSSALASSAVTATKIADAAVTNAKIAGLAVGTSKLADGAVTGVKIAAGAVGNGALASDAVTSAKIADGSVTTPKLAAGAVTQVQIADDAVGLAQLAPGNPDRLLGYDGLGNPVEVSAGTGVTISGGTISAGGGEANTASNLGSGTGIFAQKSGADLQFKSLVAGAGIALSPATDTVTITATGAAGGAHFIDAKNDFGAVGDGVTDDSAAVSSAISAGLASNRPVYFAPGTYLLSSWTVIALTNPITLMGDRARLLGPGNGSTDFAAFAGFDIEMFGLWFDRWGSVVNGGAGAADLIRIQRCEFSDFQYVLEFGATSHGPVGWVDFSHNYCHDQDRSTVAEAIVRYVGNAINRCTFTNNYMHDCSVGLSVGTASDEATVGDIAIFANNICEDIVDTGSREAHAAICRVRQSIYANNIIRNVRNSNGASMRDAEALYSKSGYALIAGNNVQDGGGDEGSIVCKGNHELMPSVGWYWLIGNQVSFTDAYNALTGPGSAGSEGFGHCFVVNSRRCYFYCNHGDNVRGSFVKFNGLNWQQAVCFGNVCEFAATNQDANQHFAYVQSAGEGSIVLMANYTAVTDGGTGTETAPERPSPSGNFLRYNEGTDNTYPFTIVIMDNLIDVTGNVVNASFAGTSAATVWIKGNLLLNTGGIASFSGTPAAAFCDHNSHSATPAGLAGLTQRFNSWN